MEQLEYVNKLVKIYGYKGLNDYKTKVSSYDIDQSPSIIKSLNETEIPNLKKHFRYSDFALTKYKNVITNGTVALGVLKKVLQQANISFDIVKSSKHNYLRLSQPNILYSKFINSLNMDQVENSINTKIVSKPKSKVLKACEDLEDGHFEKDYESDEDCPCGHKKSKPLSKKEEDEIFAKKSYADCGHVDMSKIIDETKMYDYTLNGKKDGLVHPLMGLVTQKGLYVKERVNLNCDTEEYFTPNIIEVTAMKDNKIISSSYTTIIARHADVVSNFESSHKYTLFGPCSILNDEKYIPLISMQYHNLKIKFEGDNLFNDKIRCKYDLIYMDTPERRDLAMHGVELKYNRVMCGMIGPIHNDEKLKQQEEEFFKSRHEKTYAIKLLKHHEYVIHFNLDDESLIYDIELYVQDDKGNVNYEYIKSFGITESKAPEGAVWESNNQNSRKSFKETNIDENNPIRVNEGNGYLFIKLNKLLQPNMYIIMKFKTSIKNVASIIANGDDKKPCYYILNNICYWKYGLVTGKTNQWIDENKIKHFSEL